MDGVNAFHAAQQALLAMAARAVFDAESEDAEVGALLVHVDASGVEVTLLSKQGHPIGGYTL